MPLSAYQVRTSVAVSDIREAVAFYEGKLGLRPLRSGPSAHVVDGSRVYGSGGGPALNVYQSVTAGKTPATLATWYVDDIDRIVDELTSSGVEFVRYEQFEHDGKGITARAGGGRIAWFQDPDGNTFAIEADD
ncbi:VOC family protein [Actinomadura logoneensis]|uniref:VOC family protein n=1 Tax=Actinomadura logoneensis TaxID=2293572 RepID=A0A372J9H3_9ACTN|nr:VOC family protein [Actinomadura logoneensis]